jgi:nicotinamide-nucleotide amidase
MHIELINTGSELLLGRILNTHQQWICRQMADLGYVVNRQIAIPDEARGIQEVLRESLGRSDLIILTGGLGPTSDDLTRDLLAQLLQLPLRLDQEVLAGIEQYFVSRRRVMPASARVQAMVPESARILPNPHGTAPGLAVELKPNRFRPDGEHCWLVLLPGPPRELRPMFSACLVPLLLREFPLAATFVSKTLKTTGLGESLVEEKIAGTLAPLVSAGLELGYCARVGEVEVRLAARGAEAGNLVQRAEEMVRAHLGPIIYATDDGSLESAVVRAMTARKLTLAVAESCTGGLISHRLTNVPGASAVLNGALVTYSNEAKQIFLEISAQSLDQQGAVSEEVARQMAEGARRCCRVDYAIAVTGIAGPSGGSEAKPVGTVFIALAAEDQTVVERHFNSFDRETFKFLTSQQALDLLRRSLPAD